MSDEGKITIKKPRPGRPNFLLASDGWFINLDAITCMKIEGAENGVKAVDVWLKGHSGSEPTLHLDGEPADQLVGALWRRVNVKRHFVKEEMEADDYPDAT